MLYLGAPDTSTGGKRKRTTGMTAYYLVQKELDAKRRASTASSVAVADAAAAIAAVPSSAASGVSVSLSAPNVFFPEPADDDLA